MSAVTPEMIEAGRMAHWASDPDIDLADYITAIITAALEAARSPTPHVDHWDALADFQSPDRTFLQISKTDFLARPPTSPTDGDDAELVELLREEAEFQGECFRAGRPYSNCVGALARAADRIAALSTIPTSPREGSADE